MGRPTVASWHGAVIAESEHCEYIGGVPFFPPQAVNSAYLRPSDHETVCATKGVARYYDLVVDGRVNPAAAWYYPDPRSGHGHIRDHVAFWNGVRVDNAASNGQGGGAAQRAEGPQTEDRRELLEFLLNVPKTEIHLHLEATAGAAEIFQLMERNGVKIPGIETFEDLISRFQVRDLTEFVALFVDAIQPVVQREEDLGTLVQGARDYLRRNTIPYAELFVSPSAYLKRGMDFARIVEVLSTEAAAAEADHDVRMRFIIDISRTFGPENAMRNVELTLEHGNDLILGIGLGGAEAGGPAEDYVDAFAAAREAGVHAVAHAGEDVGPESIVATVDLLKAERIGHGLSATLDPKLMARLADLHLPIECCPTSNVFTRRFISKLEEHPLPRFLDAGINACVNTDDPAIFGVDLVDEFMNVRQSMGVNRARLGKLIQNGIYATFLPKAEQDALWKKAAKIVDPFVAGGS